MRLIVFLLFSCLLASAQSAGSASALRDVAVEAAGGAEALSALRDFTATGSITIFEGERQVVGHVSIKGLRSWLRLDATLPADTRSWVVNGLGGTSKHLDKVHKLAPEVANSLRHYSLPVAVLARTVETELKDVARTDSADKLSAQNPAVSKPTEYSLDKQGLIVRVSTEVRGRSNIGHARQYFTYSDFREVNGVVFPFLIEEWNGEELVSRVQIETIVINTGLSTLEFELK